MEISNGKYEIFFSKLASDMNKTLIGIGVWGKSLQLTYFRRQNFDQISHMTIGRVWDVYTSVMNH